jgi:sigma-B regulation protein RsbU (phosphoserine phosphatase)
MSLTGLTERVKEFNLGGGISHLSLFSRTLLDKEELNAYCFILSRNGEYLVHPDPNRILHDNFFNHRNSKNNTSYEMIGTKMLAGEHGSGVAEIDGIKSMVFYSTLKHTGWSAAVVVSLRSIILPGIMLGIFILLLQGLGLLVAALFFRRAIERTTKPLKYLVHSTEEVAKGHFDTELPKLTYYDEIHQLRDSFENMQKSLTKYVNELTEATSKQAAIESELHIAGDIQNSMLPKTLPERVDMDIFASLTPAKTVGGDLYDYFIKDHQLFFCIGDVSGKGVPAAMVMTVTSTLFRSLAAKENQPAVIMDNLNNSLATNNDSLMFVTLFFGILDQSGHLTYCNAGHDAPIVLGPDGEEEYLPVDSNVAAGVTPDYKFTQQEAQLKPGSTLFLYTDGLTEAENANHELFGMDRTFEAAKAAGGSAPAEFVQKVTTSVHAFVNGADQSDDLTMMAIKYIG